MINLTGTPPEVKTPVPPRGFAVVETRRCRSSVQQGSWGPLRWPGGREQWTAGQTKWSSLTFSQGGLARGRRRGHRRQGPKNPGEDSEANFLRWAESRLHIPGPSTLWQIMSLNIMITGDCNKVPACSNLKVLLDYVVILMLAQWPIAGRESTYHSFTFPIFASACGKFASYSSASYSAFPLYCWGYISNGLSSCIHILHHYMHLFLITRGL